MKSSKIEFTWLWVLPFLALLPLTASGQGSTYQTGTTVRVNETDTLQNNFITAGQFVEIMGTIENDLFSASRNFILDGNITDDAFVVGEVLSIRGHVGDMLVAAGQSVIVDGEIQGDLFIAGGEIRLTENSHVHGNAFVGGGSIHIEGPIDGWLRAAGRRMELNGTVNGMTELYGHDITFGENYTAELGTNITSRREIYRENLGVVPANLEIIFEEPSVLPLIFFKIGFYISLLITGLVLLRIFQQTAIDIQRFATERFWKNTGVGLIGFLLIPPVILLLLLFIVTIPLSVILMLIYGLALLASYLLVAMILGVMSIFYFKEDQGISAYYWGLALGMIYIAILVNIPFLGWLFNALLLFFGLGSLLYYIWTRSQEEKAV